MMLHPRPGAAKVPCRFRTHFGNRGHCTNPNNKLGEILQIYHTFHTPKMGCISCPGPNKGCNVAKGSRFLGPLYWLSILVFTYLSPTIWLLKGSTIHTLVPFPQENKINKTNKQTWNSLSIVFDCSLILGISKCCWNMLKQYFVANFGYGSSEEMSRF